jgi:S-adenosylhomocysteine hydrolase
MGEIKTKPTSKEYRENYDRVFKRTPETLVLDDNKEVVVLIKTLDGDIYLGENSKWN